MPKFGLCFCIIQPCQAYMILKTAMHTGVSFQKDKFSEILEQETGLILEIWEKDSPLILKGHSLIIMWTQESARYSFAFLIQPRKCWIKNTIFHPAIMLSTMINISVVDHTLDIPDCSLWIMKTAVGLGWWVQKGRWREPPGWWIWSFGVYLKGRHDWKKKKKLCSIWDLPLQHIHSTRKVSAKTVLCKTSGSTDIKTELPLGQLLCMMTDGESFKTR